MGINRVTERYCPNCDSSKPFNGFHQHIAPGKKYFPYCKICTSAKLRDYIKSTGSEGAGLWCLLAEYGIPFINDIWNSTQKIISESVGSGRKPDLFLTYIRTMKEVGFLVEGFWQSDVMLTDFSGVGIQKRNEDQESIVIFDMKEQEKIWGKFTKDNYEFLNVTFDEYTRNILEMDTNLIRRYRDLAKAELRKREADESGDIQEIAKAQDNLKKMLDMLGLSDFKKKEIDERKLFIDRIAWMIEETEPAEEEDLEKYRDIAGYEKIYNSFMRSMQNKLAGTRDYPDIPKDVM